MLKKSIQITKPKPIEVMMTEKNIKSLILKYKDGKYHLSKPMFISEKDAILWLESLSLDQFDRLKNAHKIKQSDDFIYVFGEKYKLNIYDMNIKKVTVKDNMIHVYHKNFLETYLKSLLKKYVENRIKELQLVSFEVQVEVQKLTSKYGCCFYQNQRVKFASRLIHEPKEIIDSIIIHELAHFYYPNHSKTFYNYVYQHDPNYDLHQKYLKMGGVGDDPIRE